MRTKALSVIRAFYALPPAAIMFSCTTLVALCYFVLPLSAGIPIILTAAAVPWLEEQLDKNQ